MKERIVASAVRIADLVISMPAPARHHEVRIECIRLGYAIPSSDAFQGFLTSEGRFVDRDDALHVALAAKQVTTRGYERLRNGAYRLFSEDVW